MSCSAGLLGCFLVTTISKAYGDSAQSFSCEFLYQFSSDHYQTMKTYLYYPGSAFKRLIDVFAAGLLLMK